MISTSSTTTRTTAATTMAHRPNNEEEVIGLLGVYHEFHNPLAHPDTDRPQHLFHQTRSLANAHDDPGRGKVNESNKRCYWRPYSGMYMRLNSRSNRFFRCSNLEHAWTLWLRLCSTVCIYSIFYVNFASMTFFRTAINSETLTGTRRQIFT